MAIDPGHEPFHFEENLLGDGEAAAHSRRRDDQLVYMGEHHLFATMFRFRVQKCPPQKPSTLRQAKLHSVIGVVASACGKSSPPLDHTMIQKYITPKALQERWNIALEHINPKPFAVDEWRQECEISLTPHIDRLRITEADLGECETKPQSPNDHNTLIEPILAHFKLMEHTSGSDLMHAYGDFTDMVGSHYTANMQTAYEDDKPGPKALLVAEILEEAAVGCKQRIPKDKEGRTNLRHKLLEKSMTPRLLCKESEEQQPRIADMYSRATVYKNKLKQEPDEDMHHLVCDRFGDILKKPLTSELKDFVNKFARNNMNHQIIFMELRRLMPLATPRVLRSQQPTLATVEGIELLVKYIAKLKPTWTSHRYSHHNNLASAVTALLEEVEANNTMTEGPLTTAGSSNTTMEAKSGASSHELKQMTMEEMTSENFTKLEDRLTAFQKGLSPPCFGDAELQEADDRLAGHQELPKWYRPIRDITMSKSAYLLRTMLGTTKPPPRPIGVYAVELKRHYSVGVYLPVGVNDTRCKATQQPTQGS